MCSHNSPCTGSQAAPLGLYVLQPSVLTALRWLSWAALRFETLSQTCQEFRPTNPPYTPENSNALLGTQNSLATLFPGCPTILATSNHSSHKYTGEHTGFETTFKIIIVISLYCSRNNLKNNYGSWKHTHAPVSSFFGLSIFLCSRWFPNHRDSSYRFTLSAIDRWRCWTTPCSLLLWHRMVLTLSPPLLPACIRALEKSTSDSSLS